MFYEILYAAVVLKPQPRLLMAPVQPSNLHSKFCIFARRIFPQPSKSFHQAVSLSIYHFFLREINFTFHVSLRRTYRYFADEANENKPAFGRTAQCKRRQYRESSHFSSRNILKFLRIELAANLSRGNDDKR